MVVLGYQVHSSLTMLHVAREINILSKLRGCIISPYNGQLAFVRSSQHHWQALQPRSFLYWPTWLISRGSASHLSKVLTTLTWPFWLARRSGVNPVLLMQSTKQNLFSRTFTMSLLPFHAASCRAVLPYYAVHKCSINFQYMKLVTKLNMYYAHCIW